MYNNLVWAYLELFLSIFTVNTLHLVDSLNQILRL